MPRVGRVCRSLDPIPLARLGGSLWTKTFRLAGRQEGRLRDNAVQVSGPGSDSAGSLFPAAVGGDRLA